MVYSGSPVWKGKIPVAERSLLSRAMCVITSSEKNLKCREWVVRSSIQRVRKLIWLKETALTGIS